MTERSGYRALLSQRVTRWQLVTGLLAQVTQGAASIGIILVVRQHTGSLALAGAVVGLLSITAGVARPLQGRLIDRRGSRGVLAVCGVVHGGAIGGIVALADGHAPGVSLVVLGAIAGLALPPVSTTMRLEWGSLSAGADHTSAYSLVYLTQQLAILGGPLLLAAIIAAGSASLALAVVAAVACAGSVGFAATLAQSPHVVSEGALSGGTVLRVRAIQLVLCVTFCVGAAIGAIDVAVPTLATAHHEPAAAGLLIASLSIGGVCGAALYGGRRWRMPAARRLRVLLGAVTVPLAAMIAAHGLVLVAVLLFIAGIPLNPVLTTFSLLVDQHVGDSAAGEAFGWLSTAVAGGTGAASAAAASVAQNQHHARPAFVIAAVLGAVATALSVAARRTLEP